MLAKDSLLEIEQEFQFDDDPVEYLEQKPVENQKSFKKFLLQDNYSELTKMLL